MTNDHTLSVADQLADTIRTIQSNLTGRDHFAERVYASLEACKEALDFYAGHGKWQELIEESRRAAAMTPP